ncbi:MAG: RNA polymerase sigma factor region1.1 domain-containing protein, partial [Trueperaceae bacterium]|nr:RNA polymerase sigma factor region1.1 domain-containing protein [Trueperaceae bacterium]
MSEALQTDVNDMHATPEWLEAPEMQALLEQGQERGVVSAGLVKGALTRVLERTPELGDDVLDEVLEQLDLRGVEVIGDEEAGDEEAGDEGDADGAVAPADAAAPADGEALGGAGDDLGEGDATDDATDDQAAGLAGDLDEEEPDEAALAAE